MAIGVLSRYYSEPLLPFPVHEWSCSANTYWYVLVELGLFVTCHRVSWFFEYTKTLWIIFCKFRSDRSHLWKRRPLYNGMMKRSRSKTSIFILVPAFQWDLNDMKKPRHSRSTGTDGGILLRQPAQRCARDGGFRLAMMEFWRCAISPPTKHSLTPVMTLSDILHLPRIFAMAVDLIVPYNDVDGWPVAYHCRRNIMDGSSGRKRQWIWL
jgi:hypothetical protein